ncbi:MAG: methyltransferase domain-containing protein [Anaerolineaceae bacterium]|nr:methyltransferase domain-containing protein [Anaerolineaceae bacterium]
MKNNKLLSEAFTEMAPHYEETMDSELRKFWGWSYDHFVKKLIEHTTIREGDTVLDIATGTAVIPLTLSNQDPKWRKIIGLDITPAMLKRANEKIGFNPNKSSIHLACASAMVMPFPGESFDVITCGLATHHMDVPKLISEIFRLLKPNGSLTIADVGASPTWRFFLVRLFIKLLAFFYFLPTEGFARAWSEASAVSNILTAAGWENALEAAGFNDIEVIKLSTSRPFVPEPLVLRAIKNQN